MSINIIAAISRENQLGYDNKLLCHLPADLNRFKELTSNSFVVMGSNTYRSIGMLLPNRTNIILSRDPNFKVEGAIIYRSIEEAIRHYHSYFVRSDLWVIGGQQIYEQFLPYCDQIELTIIDHVFEKSDVQFPEFSLDDFKVIESLPNGIDDDHPYPYHFVTYKRKK
jgi:dihydrofolate reductase